MGVGRFPRPLRVEGVLVMLDARLDTTPHVESVCEDPAGAGVLVPSVAVRVCIDRRCVLDRVEVTRSVISEMRGLFH